MSGRTEPERTGRERTIAEGGWPRRAAGLAFALAALSPLLLATVFKPDPGGHGTHTQLGLPACGWVVAFDTPCPTCGMTTAVAHASRGDLVASFITQPAGACFALLAASCFWAGMHVAATGCRLDRHAGSILSPRSLWIAAGIAAAAWAYKIAVW